MTMTMKRTLCAASLVSLVGGCATYDLTLLPRGAGAMAHGTAKQIDKSVVITLGDETYSGKYVYVQGGSFSLANGMIGGQAATGNAVSVAAVGNGNVLAQSADGHNLRCVFSFSGWTQQGTGICLIDSGVAYDLQITR